MEIKIDKCSKNFYDEFLYVCTNYKSFIKKPNKKVHKVCTRYFLVMILIIIMIILNYLNPVYMYDMTFYLLLGALIVSLLYIFYMYNSINTMYKKSKECTFKIEEDGVGLYKESSNVILKYNSMSKIIINKHTICFLPKETLILIAIPKEYKNEVINGLKKYERDYLLVDNSELY